VDTQAIAGGQRVIAVDLCQFGSISTAAHLSVQPTR
jgi:hypothetical protein